MSYVCLRLSNKTLKFFQRAVCINLEKIPLKFDSLN
jgi:hypothetical protein